MELVVADAADEAFLLDLLNTTPVVDGTVRDELADPAAARRWMRERGTRCDESGDGGARRGQVGSAEGGAR